MITATIMVYKITEECICCGACLPECPVGAISEGDEIFVIDGIKCVDCVGWFENPQCADVCAVDACVRVNSKPSMPANPKRQLPDYLS